MTLKLAASFKIKLDATVLCRGLKVAREIFLEDLWKEFGDQGLIGVYEGTVLSAQAHELGLETESWTVDSGQAPRERDWVSSQKQIEVEIFFEEKAKAQLAHQALMTANPLFEISDPVECENRDWDAEWKASFLNNGEGVKVPPFWRVVPAWKKGTAQHERWIRINPGAGFGTGTHETTQLCLQALGEYVLETRSAANTIGKIFNALDFTQLLHKKAVLDFGSGSGILGIAAGLLGAVVDAVEIDPLAVDNARENLNLNHLQAVAEFSEKCTVRFFETLQDFELKKYDIVFANILRPVLLEFCEDITSRIAPGGVLILSGLIESDVDFIITRYRAALGLKSDESGPRVLELNEWRAVVFRN